MISGVMPCSGWFTSGHPYKHSIASWARACDEIVVILSGHEEKEKVFTTLAELGISNVQVRVINQPTLNSFASYGSYLLFGVFYCNDPDWVISIEADFLISPSEAQRLKDLLNNAKPEDEVLMADVRTLNYNGTMSLYQQEFHKWFSPHDGYTWVRPIGYRPKRGILPIPFEAMGPPGDTVNCEGVIAMQPGKWGKTFCSKICHNPDNLNLLWSGTKVEHLTFTRSPQCVLSKLAHPHWEANDINLMKVLDGTNPFSPSYPDLDNVKASYAVWEQELRDSLKN